MFCPSDPILFPPLQLYIYGLIKNQLYKIVGFINLIIMGNKVQHPSILFKGKRVLVRNGQLHLNNMHIQDEDIAQLMEQIQRLRIEIRIISLNQNRLTERGIQTISSDCFQSLSVLALQGCRIRAQGLKILAKGPFSSLISLNISENDIGAEGVKHLSTSEFKNLSILRISKNQIGFSGMKHLLNAPFKTLSILEINYNRLGVEGAMQLINCPFQMLSILGFNGQIRKTAQLLMSFYPQMKVVNY